MPFCTLETNIPLSGVPEEFRQKFIEFVANLLSKPPNYVVLKLHTGLDMKCGLTDDPFIHVKITSIGSFDGTNTTSYGKPLYDFFQEVWPAIPQKRLVILLEDLNPQYLLWKR